MESSDDKKRHDTCKKGIKKMKDYSKELNESVDGASA